MKHHHPAIRQHFNSPVTMSGLGQVYQHMAQGFFTNGINNTIKKFNAIKAGKAPIKVGTTASNRAKLLKILQTDRPDTSRAAMNKAKLHKAQSK